MVTVEYACGDGTPFPVTFASDEDAALEWRLEREHSIGRMTPLTAALGRIGRSGGERAYAEAGLPFPSMWREGPSANGFPYFVSRPPEGEEMAKLVEGCAVLVQQYGSALGIWQELSLPRVRAACSWLQSAPVDTPVAVLAERQEYAQHHTMVSSMVTWNDMQLMSAVCAPLYGERAELVAYELSQGYDNATLRANHELWQLARMAANEPPLAAAVAGPEPAGAMAELRRGGRHTAFFDALDRFLAEYGWRAETWSTDAPTWREQGDGLWSQLRHLAADGVPAPQEAVRRAAVRRTALAAEIEARLADDPEQQRRFHRRLERLACYVPVREERALWQLIAVGSLRAAVLRRGGHLAVRGVVDEPGDVFFLSPNELDDPPGDLRAVVGDRRAEHAYWRAVRPPRVIGAVGTGATTGSAGSPTLHGVPASRGVAKGRARVIVDVAEAHRLLPGDVLVCPMTAPGWTPLFAVASAVVTDSGDIGSHPAIAAREYGIPCVVGTDVATEVIPDGAEVMVDGAAGTVEARSAHPVE